LTCPTGVGRGPSCHYKNKTTTRLKTATIQRRTNLGVRLAKVVAANDREGSFLWNLTSDHREVYVSNPVEVPEVLG